MYMKKLIAAYNIDFYVFFHVFVIKCHQKYNSMMSLFLVKITL